MKHIMISMRTPDGERKTCANVEPIGLPEDMSLEEAADIFNFKAAKRDIQFHVEEKGEDDESIRANEIRSTPR